MTGATEAVTPEQVRISPQQYLALTDGINSATNRGHDPFSATVWGILCAGIAIDPTAPGAYEIIVDYQIDHRAHFA